MNAKYSAREKDNLLQNAFNRLTNRGINSVWSTSTSPFSDLRDECRQLMTDSAFTQEIQVYLQSRSVLRRSVTMFFTHIAMAARAQWDTVPEDIRPVTARGWFLGRWIPTFLIIDGPIGRFLCSGDSPLNRLLRGKHVQYPLLASARDFLNNQLFRQLSNRLRITSRFAVTGLLTMPPNLFLDTHLGMDLVIDQFKELSHTLLLMTGKMELKLLTYTKQRPTHFTL